MTRVYTHIVDLPPASQYEREGGPEVRHCFYAVRDKAKDYLSLEV